MVKVTEGCWMLKAGVKVDWMQNVEKIVEKASEVKLLLTKPLRDRGDTLNSSTITTYITSPAPDIIGVKHIHWAGKVDLGPHFELKNSESAARVVVTRTSPSTKEDVEQVLEYHSGGLKLVVNTSRNKLAFDFVSNHGEKLTGHSFRSIGYVRDEKEGGTYADGIFREAKGYMLSELDIGVGEKIYGLGERFGAFVKNGQTIDCWNEDGGTSSELSYKNIPFYMSSKGYGVFVNHPSKVSFEIQSEHMARINISVADEELQYFVIYGPTPKDVIKKYTALTGRPSLPPTWSYNLWLTTSFTTNYSEETVTGFLDGFKERKLPLGTFHFDCFWMKGYQWCDFEFDTDMFPDPPAYLKRLKERGLKLCVWINPYVGQESALFAEGKAKGYFIKRTDGSVWQWDFWQAGMAVIDFTNEDARSWYESHLHRLMDMGVDSFKTDFGERIPFKNIVYHDGSDPVRMHNYYTFIFNKTVHDVVQGRLEETTGGCLFARSATVGGQQFPVHWGGDCESTFEAMAESLRGGLSLSLCGFGFWAHDIGGFEGKPDPAIYKRWCQFGLLSSHSRLHGSGSFRVPWLFGEEAVDTLRQFTLLKLSLLPYLLQEARHASHEGLSVMRAMFVEFSGDRNTYTVDTQYMLGSNLLVAPVFTQSGEVEFYVPENEETGDSEWTSWFTGKKYKPGKWYKETHGFDSVPLLVRPSSIIATYKNAVDTDMRDFYTSGSFELVINGPVTKKISAEVIDPKQNDKVVGEVYVEQEGEKGIRIRADVLKGLDWTVRHLSSDRWSTTEQRVAKESQKDGSILFKVEGDNVGVDLDYSTTSQ